MEYTCKSEVAWQLEQIKLQYEAAQGGFMAWLREQLATRSSLQK